MPRIATPDGVSRKPKDLFLQFVTFPQLPIVAGLNQQRISTGLSMRGELIWLIHWVEFHVYPFPYLNDTTFQLSFALSTVSGLSTFPDNVSRGLIDMYSLTKRFPPGADDDWLVETPVRHQFLPPIPLAASEITMYVQSSHGINERVWCRLGITTAPLSSATYIEIAETWGW